MTSHRSCRWAPIQFLNQSGYNGMTRLEFRPVDSLTSTTSWSNLVSKSMIVTLEHSQVLDKRKLFLVYWLMTYPLIRKTVTTGLISAFAIQIFIFLTSSSGFSYFQQLYMRISTSIWRQYMFLFSLSLWHCYVRNLIKTSRTNHAIFLITRSLEVKVKSIYHGSYFFFFFSLQ